MVPGPIGLPAGWPASSARRPGRQACAASRGLPIESRPTTPRTISAPAGTAGSPGPGALTGSPPGAVRLHEENPLFGAKPPNLPGGESFELHPAPVRRAGDGGLAQAGARKDEVPRSRRLSGERLPQRPGLSEEEADVLSGGEYLGRGSQDGGPPPGRVAPAREGFENARFAPAAHGGNHRSRPHAHGLDQGAGAHRETALARAPRSSRRRMPTSSSESWERCLTTMWFG